MDKKEIVGELERIKKGLGLCESINDFADVETDIEILIGRITGRNTVGRKPNKS